MDPIIQNGGACDAESADGNRHFSRGALPSIGENVMCAEMPKFGLRLSHHGGPPVFSVCHVHGIDWQQRLVRLQKHTVAADRTEQVFRIRLPERISYTDGPRR